MLLMPFQMEKMPAGCLPAWRARKVNAPAPTRRHALAAAPGFSSQAARLTSMRPGVEQSVLMRLLPRVDFVRSRVGTAKKIRMPVLRRQRCIVRMRRLDAAPGQGKCRRAFGGAAVTEQRGQLGRYFREGQDFAAMGANEGRGLLAWGE